MRRSRCLAALMLLCVFLTVAAFDARQPRPDIAEMREVADNLYVLLNEPDSQDLQTGREHGGLPDGDWCGARRHEAGGLRAGYSRVGP